MGGAQGSSGVILNRLQWDSVWIKNSGQGCYLVLPATREAGVGAALQGIDAVSRLWVCGRQECPLGALQPISPWDHRRSWWSVVATGSGKQTHSEGQCSLMQWSAVYYSGGPKAESPLSQGPQPVFVKTL